MLICRPSLHVSIDLCRHAHVPLSVCCLHMHACSPTCDHLSACVCVSVWDEVRQQGLLFHFLWVVGGVLNKEALSCPLEPAGWKLAPACVPACHSVVVDSPVWESSTVSLLLETKSHWHSFCIDCSLANLTTGKFIFSSQNTLDSLGTSLLFVVFFLNTMKICWFCECANKTWGPWLMQTMSG